MSGPNYSSQNNRGRKKVNNNAPCSFYGWEPQEPLNVITTSHFGLERNAVRGYSTRSIASSTSSIQTNLVDQSVKQADLPSRPQTGDFKRNCLWSHHRCITGWVGAVMRNRAMARYLLYNASRALALLLLPKSFLRDRRRRSVRLQVSALRPTRGELGGKLTCQVLRVSF